jgi:hypothetical protein
MTCGSPASSDDGSVGSWEGGAPLYAAWSPDRALREEDVGSSSKFSSFADRVAGNSAHKHPKAQVGFGAEQDPKTPSDQGIKTPEPIKPKRSFSKSSTLRPGAQAFPIPTTTSAGVVPPALNLAAYPGPGGIPQRQPSLPILVPAPPVVGAIPIPVAMPASQAQARPSLSGSTTHSFIAAMQAMNLNAAEENIHPAQKASHPISSILQLQLSAVSCVLTSPHQTHRDETCKLQARIWGLRQGLYRQPGVAQEFLTSFDYDVRELMSNTVKMNQALDTLADELEKAKAEKESIRGLEATIRDLEGDLKDYKKRAENAETTLKSVAGRSEEDMRTIQVRNPAQRPEGRVTDAKHSFSRSSFARMRWLRR